MRRLVYLLVGLCLCASPLFAQTPCPSPCTLTVGQTYAVTASHDGLNVTGYRVYLDGAKLGADLPITALQSGTVTVAALTAPARGAHSLQLAAFNEDAETKSDPYAFTVKKAAPAKPGPVQLLLSITVAEDGTVTFKMVTP
jgi:hypothetical protein